MKKIFVVLLCLALCYTQVFASDIILTEETASTTNEPIITEAVEILVDSAEPTLSDYPIIEEESIVEPYEDIDQNTASYTEEYNDDVAEYYEEVSDGEIIITDDPAYAYINIPLTEADLERLGRMAYGETMYHDGTCPANTVIACYEVVFNRYLYDINPDNNGYKFHSGELSVSKILTLGQFEGICSEAKWNRLSDEKKAEYYNLVWQVHNQGPTVLTTEYLFWQSSKGSRGKDNRIWVGFIYDEEGNKVEGTTTDKSKIVKGHGNWYRIGY